MALTADREVTHFVDQELRSFPVGGAEAIYKGSFVSVDASGYAAPLASGETFGGLAFEGKDNSGGADAALSVRVYTLGDFRHALSGATIVHIGRPVFASADDTLSFDGNGNTYVGIVQDVPTNGNIILRIDPNRRHVKTVTHAVSNLGAGVDIAARAIHTFNKEGWIVDARVTNQATASSGIDDSNTCVLTLATGAGTVVTETFDSTTTFPGANTAQDLGTIATPRAAAGAVMTLAVTNGTTADPGPFLVEVDYV